MAWNSQMGNNEYTTVEQRRKQNLSRLPVTQDPVVPAGGGSAGSAGVATVAASDPFAEYKSLLKQIAAEKQAQADAAFKTGKDNLDRARENALRESYITYMQGIKNAPQASAVSGNGGYAQSQLAKHQLNFENNRSAVEQNYLDNLRELQTNRDNGIVSSNQDYLTELASIAKTNAGKTATAAAKTAAATAAPTDYNYKLGGKSYNAQEFITYLKGLVMTQAEIARYMQANGLTL